MKVRRIIAFSAVFALVIALSVSAFAAQVNLPVKPNMVNRTEQQGWATDGAAPDGVEAHTGDIGLTVAQVVSATKLVVELNSPCPNDDNKLFIKTSDVGWSDNGDLFVQSDDKMTLTFDLTGLAHWKDAIYEGLDWIGFGVQAWNDDWLDIKAVYLEVPAGAAGGSSGGNPKTGDDFTVFFAIGALALAGVCGFVFYRKSRNNA
ncbi:MAG: LPXTG cell wall anchor domain-containing protein [Oscillospiraceae bacterium]|nr:LPXTG cell wall anchor domain-containing protein [Oscillospiraceae bacterium]